MRFLCLVHDHDWPVEAPSLGDTARTGKVNLFLTDGPFAETKEQLGGLTDVDEPEPR